MPAGKAGSPPDAVEPIEIDDEIVGEFLIESRDHLSESDDHLLALDSDPLDEDALGAVFRAFHTLKGLAGFLGFWPVEHLAHAAEDLLDQGKQIPLDADAVDAIFKAVDLLRQLTDDVEAAVPTGVWIPTRGADTAVLEERIRGILLRRDGNTAPVETDPAERDSEPDAQDATVEAGLIVLDAPDPEDVFPLEGPMEGLLIFDDPVEPAAPTKPTPEPSVPEPAKPQPAAQIPAAKPAEPAKPTPTPTATPRITTVREPIRVDADRLDQLVDLIGEMVITQSMVNRAAETMTEDANAVETWERHTNRLGKITREVHELAGGLRMVPVRPTFRKMARLARDVSKKAGKSVDFRVLGEDTELDKTLVDRIGDPLIHIIRNAVDHGLESTEEDRINVGKPPVGVVELRAFHQGGSIHITVSDDGRGLDRDVIIAKAVERGVITDGTAIDDDEVYQLICEPGFSTAQSVTAISGRGVGMDVVQRALEEMGGRLEITSELGAGTTFTLILPLTLAVIDGLVVRLAGERFVVPTLGVVRIVIPGAGDISTIRGHDEVLTLEDELIPVIRLASVLSLPDSGVGELALIAEAGNRKVALMIDGVLDEYQLVIKSLGRATAEGLSGCAILPDGRVGLVLDPLGLMRVATRQPSAMQSRDATPDQQETTYATSA